MASIRLLTKSCWMPMRALAAPSAVAASVMSEMAASTHADDLFEVGKVVVGVRQGGDVEGIGRAGDGVGHAAVGRGALGVENAGLVVGVEQLGGRRYRCRWCRSSPPARARERGHDALGGIVAGGAGVDRQPVLARERWRSRRCRAAATAARVISLWILARSTPGWRAATSLLLIWSTTSMALLMPV